MDGVKVSRKNGGLEKAIEKRHSEIAAETLDYRDKYSKSRESEQRLTS